MVIISSILDAISHTIKEALVRTQPLNQEQFNFKISIFQFIIGLITLPCIKITQSSAHKDPDSPFGSEEFDDMGWIKYMGQYVYYGLACVFNSLDTEEAKDNLFLNKGECDNSWVFIIGYTLSLFVI